MNYKKKAVVYINSDASGRGFLEAEGSHALTNVMNEIAKDITDPQTKVTVFERKKAADIVNAPTTAAKREALNRNTFEIGALGSGSDYSSFLQHVGIPSLNLGYGGEDPGGEYHSIYDSYDLYVRFKDPGFYYGVTLAQTGGRAVLRMADAEVLPFDFRSLYSTINGYTTELMSMQQKLRDSIETENLLLQRHLYVLAADPTKPYTAPQPKTIVPYIDFSPLQNALYNLQSSADSVAVVWNKAIATNTDHDALNKALYQAEQQLLTTTGLPRRGWYRHTIYAPGFYTGYGVKTMPGIREAIEQRDWKETQEQINVDAIAINKLSNYLSAIANRFK